MHNIKILWLSDIYLRTRIYSLNKYVSSSFDGPCCFVFYLNLLLFYFMGSLSSKQQYTKLIQKGSSIPIYQWQTYWNRNQKNNLFSNFVKNILNKSNPGNKILLQWNFKVTKQYFDEDTTRWKDLPCSCVHWINITKMVLVIKANYQFSVIPIKISM